MSDTPTHTAPERLLTITQLFGHNPHAAAIFNTLIQHGYVIVHPDDVLVSPTRSDKYDDAAWWWSEGWNDCRTHIFGSSDA